jgi:hypothetical protein
MRGKLAAAIVGLGAILASGSAFAQVADVCPFVDDLGEEIVNTFPFGHSTTDEVNGLSTGLENIEVEWVNGEMVIVQYSTDGGTSFTNVVTSSDAYGSESFTIPADDDIIIRRTFGVPAMSTGEIAFTCDEGTTPPPPPPPSGTAEETAAATAGAADDVRSTEPERTNTLFDDVMRVLAYTDPSLVNEPELWRRRIADQLKRLAWMRNELPLRPSQQEYLLRAIAEGEKNLAYYTRVLADLESTEQSGQPFFPQLFRSNPSLSAISDAAGGGEQTGPGEWTFDVDLAGTFIDRTFAALNRQTQMGTLTISGRKALDPGTAAALGIKLGAARTTQNTPASTIDTAQVGADAAIAHLFSPTLMGAAYVGYEFDAHRAAISGVSSFYVSHIGKIGGKLQGTIDVEEYILTPSLATLLQYEHRPSFVDGGATTIPAAGTIDADLTLGLELSRTFLLIEQNAEVTPRIGAALDLRYVATNPTPVGAIPNNLLGVQLSAGVDMLWFEGAQLGAEVEIGWRPNTMSYGLKGKFAAAID